MRELGIFASSQSPRTVSEPAPLLAVLHELNLDKLTGDLAILVKQMCSSFFSLLDKFLHPLGRNAAVLITRRDDFVPSYKLTRRIQVNRQEEWVMSNDVSHL